MESRNKLKLAAIGYRPWGDNQLARRQSFPTVPYWHWHWHWIGLDAPRREANLGGIETRARGRIVLARKDKLARIGGVSHSVTKALWAMGVGGSMSHNEHEGARIKRTVGTRGLDGDQPEDQARAPYHKPVARLGRTAQFEASPSITVDPGEGMQQHNADGPGADGTSSGASRDSLANPTPPQGNIDKTTQDQGSGSVRVPVGPCSSVARGHFILGQRFSSACGPERPNGTIIPRPTIRAVAVPPVRDITISLRRRKVPVGTPPLAWIVHAWHLGSTTVGTPQPD
ncbi:hypothetical protein F5148DRAFT_1149834 [Russula earlei]|uniref:Uncharacterized protein n=1 Tax=Russula earlei TaxID=71964 RepID=A0ACC0U728_9AGAM|nr:hypothetical protein F5148DRAFT_1149834 [Russula earlei]